MKGILFVLGAVLLLVLVLAGALLVAGGASGRAVNQAAIEIERPPAEVFPWLTEPEKLTQWIGGLVESTRLTAGGPRVGARSREVVAMGKKRTEMESEVTALEPGRLLAVRLASPGFAADARYELEEVGGRTRLRYRVDSQYNGFLFRLLSPVMTPAAQRKLEEDLGRLKARVERAG